MFADLIGGVSVTGLLIPEALAYSSIAGLPVAFGITAAVIGPLAYAAIGRSRFAVVSATSGAAALLAAAIGNAALPDISRADCAVALTLLVGLFLVLGAVLRIATLTSFISRAVLHGFGFGLAVTICIRQLPALMGLPATQGSPWQIVMFLAVRLREIHLPSFALGVGAIVFLGVSRRVKFAPVGLVLIILAVLAMGMGPADHLGIATVGPFRLEPALPHVPIIAVKVWGRLAQFAVPVAIVILAESWATIRSLAAVNGDAVSPEREIAALGFANLASGVMRGLPVGAGFSVSNANTRAGTATRYGAAIAAIGAALLVYVGSDGIALIPEPVLAATVISALTHALSPKPIVSLFRLGRDQWVAVFAAVAVIALGISNGLLIAVGLSVLGLLKRLAYPKLSELGRTGQHDFVDRAAHPEAKPVPKVLILRPDAPLFFGNAEAILGAVEKKARDQAAATVVLSLEETDDLDSSTLEALADFKNTLGAQHRMLILARVHDRVRMMLERAGLADLAATSTFSVDDAVQIATNSSKTGLSGRGAPSPGEREERD